MNHTLEKLISPVLLTLLLISSSAHANEQRGLEIAKQADLRDTGYNDSTARLIMELKNKQGDTSIRHVRVKNLEVADDGDKGMSIFDQPADVKGTAFLTYSHSLKADEQWLYLPSLKRIKRISSKNKSGPFMGSEFAYEDISSQEVDK
ncbi:MAG: outer membrane lipoprotein-sorting protein, partial [Gammaproteobacteria bacterium]|nr:outer membrane lipoprotein-sorting protein [Gammaproteobacteria bacterium]